MANKYHKAALEASIKNNMERASSNAGIKFTTLGEIADYNASKRAEAKKSKAYSKKRDARMKASKKKVVPKRSGLPTGYDK